MSEPLRPRARPAVEREWRELGELLGRAFQDDPLWTWISVDPARRSRHVGPLFAQLIRDRVVAGTVTTTDDLAGAAVWAEPGAWKSRPEELARMTLPFVRCTGLRNVRSRMDALQGIERHHPEEAHWYLEIIGSDLDRRGQGIGAALMERGLERCDRDGLPAYLESSKEQNLSFYHRFGFEETDEIKLSPQCPPIWPMWRAAR